MKRERSMRFASAVLSAGAIAVMTSAAAAQVITDGDSSFNLPASSTAGATIRTGTGGGATGVYTAGGDTTDQLFQQWWWYRVNGTNPREFALSNRTSNTAVGNTLTLAYTEPEGFNATVVYVLTDGPNSPAACNVATTLDLTNTGGSALSMAVFCYLDYDLEGAGSDSATLVEPGRMRIADTTGFAGQFLAINPTAYDVAAFATVRTKLTDADVDNFANAGLPFAPADWTGAFQWNIELPAGGSTTLRAAFSLNQDAVAGDDCDPCDTNCDGSINAFDIQPFVDILAGSGTQCSPCAGDTNDDGSLNGFDIQGFVNCLGG